MVDIHVNDNTNQIRINVNPTSNSVSPAIGNEVFYNGLAKEWAISEDLVQGIDYSAKHYAGQAKQSEEIATDAISQIRTSVEEAAGYAQNAQESAEYIVNNAPEASIEQTSTGAIITTKDLTHGTTTATILNGAKGDKGDTGEKGEKGETGAKGDKGDTGDDGYSPTATVSKTGDVTTISITDKNGTTTANVYDGVGSITDVQVDGTSVLDGSIAKIDLTGKYDASNPDGFISDITSIDVITALGYTPYDATNPNNYITASALTGYATEQWVSNQNYVNSTTLATTLADYQPLLVSGTNIKTINNESILGSGNININSRNVGEIVTSSLPLTDAGLHLLDGSLLQYGIYKDFIDYIAGLYTSNSSANYFCTETEWQNSVTTYGSCGKFVYDSTNNTVRLPKVSDILQGTTDTNALGNLIEAGLPNITGNIAPLYYSGSEAYANGAFTQTAFYNTGITSGSQIGQCGTNFDASRSSSIYGNSSTVQPQTIKVLYYIVVATSVKTDIEVDIDQVATDLNSKADANLTNVTDSAKVLMSGMGMPSETWVDLAWGASGTEYVAPANGYYNVVGRALQVGQYVAANITKADGTLIYSVGDAGAFANQQVKINFPVRKGQHFWFYWTAAGTDFRIFRFIYAVGSESEAR